MKYFVVILFGVMTFSVYANDSSPANDGVIIQNSPCKGTPESQKVVIHSKDNQSVELECHHMLPQVK
ncbi:hypothetical protein MUU46_04500 [Scandinavium sp. TWS1a]|uniref:hypothetical protein n=1 Tax=Scandinavium tedordense TaxID=2926521 RepID=UPI002165FF78|nr:hypothetical protein [Scandinavium tedordense]MCS2169586.1 hypothetical protein [Scandinavium tedordense]